ncbi:MAG: UbiA-like polyprenyltransferase [Bacteroidota bacterium]
MKNYLSLIKFSHTIFALPFALLGFFIGMQRYGDGIDWRLFALVLLCMVFARSAAMAFNRYLDRDIDERNPRTATREIPAGIISPGAALAFVIINCLLFIFTAWWINPLCFYLSPIALLVILGYSYTKRFTYLCHFVLGLGLALAPIGAYLAAGGQFDLIPLLYSFAVLLWVSGFDIIYALQDEQFDRSLNLHSVPTALGKVKALQLSSALHLICGGLILFAAYQLSLQPELFGWIHWVGALIFITLLVYQHRLVSPEDLSRVNLAFFTTNGFASLILGCLIILDLFV